MRKKIVDSPRIIIRGEFSLPHLTTEQLILQIGKWSSAAVGDVWYIEAVAQKPRGNILYLRCDKSGVFHKYDNIPMTERDLWNYLSPDDAYEAMIKFGLGVL